MIVTVRVFRRSLLVQVGNGMWHRFYDWVMVLDFVRPDDTLFIQVFSGEAAR